MHGGVCCGALNETIAKLYLLIKNKTAIILSIAYAQRSLLGSAKQKNIAKFYLLE